MKKSILFSIVFMLFLSFSLSAQERGQRERLTPAEEAKRNVERLHKELKLTDKQQADLTTHYTEAAKKRQEQMSGGDREKMREWMQKNREENDKRLKEILTDDQYKTYQANEKKRQEERGQRGEERGSQGGNRGGRN